MAIKLGSLKRDTEIVCQDGEDTVKFVFRFPIQEERDFEEYYRDIGLPDGVALKDFTIKQEDVRRHTAKQIRRSLVKCEGITGPDGKEIDTSDEEAQQIVFEYGTTLKGFLSKVFQAYNGVRKKTHRLARCSRRFRMESRTLYRMRTTSRLPVLPIRDRSRN